MKPFILLTALAVASPVHAETIQARITDHYKVETRSTPFVKKECGEVNVPVYGTVQRQGNAGVDAFVGMIVGGLLGKAVTGKDDGAAAGAVMGGVIGADKSKPTTQQVVTGHRKEMKCVDVTYYREERVRAYDYSTITFDDNGFIYEVVFYKSP